jgi:hypothetical protein
MRDGLDAPTFELPAENVADIQAFLDAQSRFKLAVWLRHEQLGVDGPHHDHHLVLAVEDEDWATGDMQALDAGMRLPALDTREKTWIDIYPVSEVDVLRAFGTVLWEQTSPGEDPLNYRLTREPVTVPAEALATFRSLVRSAPDVVRVTATLSRLWKDECEVEHRTSLWVVGDLERSSPPGPLGPVLEAAREAGIQHDGGTLAGPQDIADGTLLYEAAT